MSIYFKVTIEEFGASFSFFEKSIIGKEKIIPIDNWDQKADAVTFKGVSYLSSMIEEERATVLGDSVVVLHQDIASISNEIASSINLPAALPWVMVLQHNGTLDRAEFSLSLSWRDQGQSLIGETRVGAFMYKGSRSYRVPNPLYSLIEAVESFEKSDTTNENIRFKAWVKIQELIPGQIEAGKVKTNSEFLHTVRIVHASSFSLDIASGSNGFTFEPVLFEAQKYIEENGKTSHALLTPALQEKFSKERFNKSRSVSKNYSIGGGWVVVLDDNLVKALAIVKKAQSADRDTRKEFAKNPRKYLKTQLNKSIDEELVEQLFLETSEYSQRVIEVGLWESKVIPWVKRQPETWLPEKFGFQVGDSFVEVSIDDVVSFKDKVNKAINNGSPMVDWKGEKYPANEKMQKVAAALTGLASPSNTNTKEDIVDLKNSQEEETQGSVVLIIDDNFEVVGTETSYVPRTCYSNSPLPNSLQTTLKKHQDEGLEWLQKSWKVGQNGVLLADDMGLGKTLLSLTFMAWLRQGMEEGKINKGPILIVAPTGLLKNWEDEHSMHFVSPGLGNICRVYGQELKNLRFKKGNEIDLGVPNLDKDEIQNADWVLTTYETLRDYQHSFGAIKFSCGVFDEMQKIKTPGTVVTEASKAMNIDFKIGITGTPIENRLSDLWCLVDTLEPGLLGDLKSFSKQYEKQATPDCLKELKKLLCSGSEAQEAIMLRRMKDECLDGLPAKIEHVSGDGLLPEVFMPDVQAERYAEEVIKGNAAKGRPGAMLEAIHQFKSISLHPKHPDEAEGLSYIDYSARFIALFKILDDIKNKNERALIFVESLAIHKTLPDLIKKKYNLPQRPMTISGEISGPKRKEQVDLFQKNDSEFDVMVLSPKAGGVGLTITSANHVIHLSRWWNPAVEDQCTDRVYRIGQTRPVHVYYLLAKHPQYGEGSFDYNLDALLKKKRALSREMLMPPENKSSDSADLFDMSIGVDPDCTITHDLSVEEVRCMQPIEFEEYVLELFKNNGYEVNRTKTSWDYGADGIVKNNKTGEEVIIQVKHTQRDVPCVESAVHELLKAREAYEKPKAKLMVVTNHPKFSAATILAGENNDVALESVHDLF